jgi:putative flippase GtrA
MKLFKFMVVGGIGAILSLGLMYLFTTVLGLFYLISYFITFMIVVAFNYTLNSLWTFKGYKSKGVIMFYAGRMGTLALNEAILFLMVSILGWPYLLATAIAILISVSLNYSFSRRFVWQNLKVT